MATTDERLSRGDASAQLGQIDRSKWNDTISQVERMGYAQNPAAPPAPRPNSFGDAAAAMGNPGTVQPRSTFGSMAAQAATPAAPVASAAPAARSVSPSGLYFQDRGQELKDQWGQGQYAQAAGTAARTAVQGAGMYALEAADKLASPWMDAARSFGRGVAGAPASAAPARPAPPAPGAPAAPNPTDQRLAAGIQAAPMGLAAAALASPPPAASPATPANQVMPGVFNHGRGQYSDQAGGMGMPSSFTGQPNAQNLAAAEALSQRGAQAALAQPPRSMMEPAGITAPTVRHSGNDWQMRNDLRNAQVSASSITNDGGRWDQHKGVSAARAYAAGLEQADTQARFAQPAYDMKAASENASTGRESMRQAGALQREGMQQAGANARAVLSSGIDQQRVGIEQERANIANRAEHQLETQRAIAIDPRSTPEQRAAAERALMTLQGRAQPAEWGVQVTPTTKNLDGSTSMGSIVRYNKATGQTEIVNPGQGRAQTVSSPEQLAALPSGAVYVGPDGKQYRKN